MKRELSGSFSSFDEPSLENKMNSNLMGRELDIALMEISNKNSCFHLGNGLTQSAGTLFYVPCQKQNRS